jgi:hypothetical protein
MCSIATEGVPRANKGHPKRWMSYPNPFSNGADQIGSFQSYLTSMLHMVENVLLADIVRWVNELKDVTRICGGHDI